MKKLICEMCGGSDLVKSEGVFVCQSCGCKYSIEEAKKMMIEGVVDVSGSKVVLDNSNELKNLFELARRAKKDGNVESAQKYYEQIIVKDPSSWEATFYTAYYQSFDCSLIDVYGVSKGLKNNAITVLKLINENVTNQEEINNAVVEVGERVRSISLMLYNFAKNNFDTKPVQVQSDRDEMMKRCCAARDIQYSYGDNLVQIFGDTYGKDVAVPCWKNGVNMHNILMKYGFAHEEINKEEILSYVYKIQKYDESYETPVINTDQGGCYIATAVYGSYDCPEVWTLRRFRDNDLAATWYGRAFIHTYYTISPIIVKWFGHTNWFKKIWKGKLDRMVKKLQDRGYECTPYEDRYWK